MKQQTQLEAQLMRWTDAGFIDKNIAARILSFEAASERHTTLRWPVLLVLIFGGIMVAAGVTLFVAAHWDQIPQAARFVVVLLMVAIFHGAGAQLSQRYPALSSTLHALGTVALGPSILLTAQNFNLHKGWATGILLWAIGAAIGFVLLRNSFHAAALSLLVPAWLIAQWESTTQRSLNGNLPLAIGLLLTPLCYLAAGVGGQVGRTRRALIWVGAVALLPCAAVAIAIAMRAEDVWPDYPRLPSGTYVLGSIIALGGPLLLAWLLRGRAAWVNLVFGAWVVGLVQSAQHTRRNPYLGNYGTGINLGVTLIFYLFCALGAAGLVAWGLREKRKERVNLGIASFAITVLFFYFDSFMSKIGRSTSLLTLGALCIAGGYALECTRRQLIARLEAAR